MKMKLILVCLLIIGIAGCVNKKRIKDDIIPQKCKSRKYVSISLPLILDVDLAELNPPLFMPTYLQVDEQGFVYTLSWRNFRIYRFLLSDRFKKNDLLVFGKGRGQGPGELSQPMDLKVLGRQIFISDQNTGSLEVYSTSGEYIKRITFHDKEQLVFPIRIVPMDRGLVIHTIRQKPGMLFSLSDEEGSVIYSYGNHYNQEWTSLVLRDGQTSNGFSSRQFYFFPLYLGFTYLFNERRLVFIKETIDGVRNLGKRESNDSIEKAKEYMTARSFAMGRDFIMVIARDRIEKKSYWDVYRLRDFTYLFSLAEPPPTREIAITKNSLVCMDMERMTVYGLNEFFLHVKKHCLALDTSD